MQDIQKVYDRILYYKQGRDTFVETGTAVGETCLWASSHFDKVVTVEYMDDLYESSVERLWNVDNIKLIHGDSALWVPLIVRAVGPAVWFLDAHNVNRQDGLTPPQETVVMKEIVEVSRALISKHIIIVDDLRLFGDVEGYPSMDDIKEFAETVHMKVKEIPEEDLFVMGRGI